MGNDCCAQQERSKNFTIIDVPPLETHQISNVALEENLKNEQQEVQEKQIDNENIVVEVQSLKIPELDPRLIQCLEVLGPFKHQYSTDEPISDPKYYPQTNLIYHGQWKDGKPEGKGSLYMQNGSLFEGSFKQGITSGISRIIFKDGSYYQGNVVGMNAEGIGEYSSQKIKYKGNFHQNQLHGNGTEKTCDGVFFQGIYENGIKKKGMMQWDKNTYQGEFDNQGRFHGFGKLSTPNGVYQGYFMDGLKHGQGVYKKYTGTKYEGSYSHGMKCGYGCFYNCDGNPSYKGYWADGMPHGIGTFYTDGVPRKSTEWVYGIAKIYEQKASISADRDD